MNIIQHPSPNCNPRDGHSIDMLVLHYTGMKSGANALDRMCDATAEVSAHYMVEEDGRIFQLVNEEMRAWHAGLSYWRGHTNINQRSIGIEIVNPGHEFGYRGFPEMQMQSVIALCKDIVQRRHIPARNVVAHSDVAPARKQDPGELFDWKRLAVEGVGLFPSPLEGEGRVGGGEAGGNIANISFAATTPLPNPLPGGERELAQFGYDTADLPAAIAAFQRHFRPNLLNGQWDAECKAALQQMLAEFYF